MQPPNITDLAAGWALTDEQPPAVADPAEAWGHVQDSYQIAGVAGPASRALSRAARRTTKEIFEGASTPPALRVDRERIKNLLDQVPSTLDEPALDQKFIDTGTLNIERSHIGNAPIEELRQAAGNDIGAMLDAAESAEDVAKVFNVIGREMDLKVDPRTHASIKARSREQMLKDLEPILEGRQAGLATDRQLYALSSALAKVGEETVSMARVIKAGRGTDEIRVKYAQSLETAAALEATLVGHTREVARALGARRIYGNSLAMGDISELNSSLARGGTSAEAIDASADVLLTNLLRDGTTGAMHKAAMRRSGLEALVEYWKANVLSGPKTHLINVGMTSAVQLYENFLVNPTAAAISTARRGTRELLGAPAGSGVYFSEMIPGTHGAMLGMIDGLKSSFEILLNPKSQGVFGSAGRMDTTGSAVAEKLGELGGKFGGETGEMVGAQAGHMLTAGLRLLRIEDEVFKSVAYRSRLGQLAMRDGLDRGLAGEKLMQHLQNLQDSPTYDMHKAAIQHAEMTTMQDREVGGLTGAVGEWVAQIADSLPALKFIVPFVRTMTNIQAYAIDNSVLAPFALDIRADVAMSERLKFFSDLKKGGPEADYAFARFVLGSAMATAIYSLYQAGKIIGPGPDNRAQQAPLDKLGYQPNSIVVDGKAYSIDRADPFASQVALVTGAFDKARFSKTDKDATEHMLDAISSFANHLMDSTFMENAQRFMQVMFGGETLGTGAAKFLGATLTGFVPYSAAISSLGSASDETGRKASLPRGLGIGGEGTLEDIGQTIGQIGAARLPWKRDELRPARYWDGSVIVPEAHQLVRLIAPTEVRNINDDPPSLALAKNGVGVAEVKPQVTIYGVQFNLLDLDFGKGLVFDEYIKDIGETRRAAVLEAIQGSEYSGLESGVSSKRAILLERAIAKGGAAGETKFFKETLPRLAEEKKVDLSALALALGTAPELLISDIKEGRLKSAATLRFEARGAPGKKEVELPAFSFEGEAK